MKTTKVSKLPETLPCYNGMQPGQRVVYCPSGSDPKYITIKRIERVRVSHSDDTAVRFYTDDLHHRDDWVVASHEPVMSLPAWGDHISQHCRADPVVSFLIQEIERLSREVKALRGMSGIRD